MIAILGDHRFHHYAITRQPFFYDARLTRRHRDRTLLAAAADALFALGHAHKIPRRFHIHHFAFVVADQGGFGAALFAGLLRAPDHFFYARQALRQALSSRMRLPLPRRCAGHRRTSGFRLHFVTGGARLFLRQQLQLQITKDFAAWPQHLHALLPQFFGERLDLQVHPRQLPFQHCDACLRIECTHASKFDCKSDDNLLPVISNVNTK